MEENLHKDPLEAIFQKKLQDTNLANQEASSDNWDVPSDKVWETIHNDLTESNDLPPSAGYNRWRLLAGVGLFVVVLGVLYCFYSYQQQLSSLSQQVEELTARQGIEQTETADKNTVTKTQEPSTAIIENLKTSDASTAPLKSTDGVESNTKTEASFAPNSVTPSSKQKEQETAIANSSNSPQKNIPNAPPSKSETKQLPTDKLNTPTPQYQTPSTKYRTPNTKHQPTITTAEQAEQPLQNTIAKETITPFVDDSKPVFTDPISPITSAKENATPPAINETKVLLEPVPILPAPKIPLLEKRQGIQALHQAPSPIIEPLGRTPNRGFYAGVFMAPTTALVQVKKKSGGLMPGSDFFKDKTSYQLLEGVKLGYQIADRWALEIDGQQSKYTLASRHRVRLLYSRQNERPVNNQHVESNYRLAIPTAYGEVDTDVSLYRESGTAINDAAAIPLELKTTQELHFLTIPVAIKYRLGTGAFRLTAKTGLAFNFLLDNKTTLTAATISRRGLSLNKTVVTQENRALKKNTLDYLLGVGLDVQMTKRWHFVLEPTLSRSINPIFDNSKLKSFPVKMSLSLGVNYQI